MIHDVPLLVVDDEPQIQDLLCRRFSRLGYVTRSCSGAREAEPIIDQWQPRIVITDLRMAKGDGTELMEHIQQRAVPRPLVALMSAFADVSLPEVMDRGGFDLFAKPIDFDAVALRLAQMLLPEEERWRTTTKFEKLDLRIELDDFDRAEREGTVGLGRAGLFVKQESVVASEGDQLTFCISATKGRIKELTGIGKVRWKRQRGARMFHTGIGVEFVELSAASVAVVVAQIAERDPRAFIPLGLERPMMR